MSFMTTSLIYFHEQSSNYLASFSSQDLHRPVVVDPVLFLGRVHHRFADRVRSLLPISRVASSGVILKILDAIGGNETNSIINENSKI